LQRVFDGMIAAAQGVESEQLTGGCVVCVFNLEQHMRRMAAQHPSRLGTRQTSRVQTGGREAGARGIRWTNDKQ